MRICGYGTHAVQLEMRSSEENADQSKNLGLQSINQKSSRAAGVVGSGLEQAEHRFLQVPGAQPMDEWTTYRITGKTLEDMGCEE